MFFHRGDPAVTDFVLADLTTDGDWQDLDLSSIVGSDTVAVNISVTIYNVDPGRNVLFRKKGNTSNANKELIYTQVANKTLSEQKMVACDINQVIQYAAYPTGWIALDIMVNSWFTQ